MPAYQPTRPSLSAIRAIRDTVIEQHRGWSSFQPPTPVWQEIGRVIAVILLMTVVATTPAAAQDGTTNPVCADESNTLPDMIEGFVQITTGLGIMGLLVVWQADALMEMFTIGREQKAKLKQHKRGAMRSAAVLVLLGPLFTVGGAAMGLPIASCVNLIPF